MWKKDKEEHSALVHSNSNEFTHEEKWSCGESWLLQSLTAVAVWIINKMVLFGMFWKYFFHPLHARKYIFLSLMNKLTHSSVLARKNSRHQMINLRQKRFGKANLKFYTITYISFMFNTVRHVTLVKRRLCEFVFTKRKTLTRS